MELKDGRWYAFEIKLEANQIDKAVENLIEIRDAIASAGGEVPSVLAVFFGICAPGWCVHGFRGQPEE